MKHLFPRLLVAAHCLPLVAQSFSDLTDVRNPPQAYSSLFQVEAGAIATQAAHRDASTGLANDVSWDGSVYYRDETFSSRKGTLEAYAGRDGIFAGFTDGKLVGDDTVTRLELRARPWQFYRDGSYRGDMLVPNGFYEGSDYEGYLGFGREAQQGLYIELGPFYKKLKFDRSNLTAPTFTIPTDFAAYGGRLYLEQSTVQMDRRRGLARDGYIFTLTGEREWNDSTGSFGTSGFATELPSAVWRLRGRLEWYIPASESATWEIFARGGWQDQKDRVQNFEAQKPLGNQWADAQLRLRFHLGQSITFTPFFQLQYSSVLTEFGDRSTRDFFFGGGAESYIHFSEALSLHAWYSYLGNENRPSIRIDEDVHGQNMFYLGMVLRLGSARR